MESTTLASSLTERVKDLQKEQITSAPFGLMRPLAYIMLTLIILLSILFSTYIGNSSRNILRAKQEDFASLLAENLNHQIYRRFTLPTVIGYGSVALRQPAQYERLDQVIQSIIHGLNVNHLHIFGHDNTITYSLKKEELGSVPNDTKSVMAASVGVEPIFTIKSTLPYWQGFFSFNIPPMTYTLYTAYPLRIENRLNSSTELGPVMGVLEFTQDITADIEKSFQFQKLVLLLTIVSTSLIFFLLLLFVRRAERDRAMRMAEEQRLGLELHQSEKMAGMGRVVASIAHEIRNPLGIIRSSAELLLKRDVGKDPIVGKILQAIYDESKRLTQTVSDFLDYARPRTLTNGTVDIVLTIDKALTFLEPELQSRQVLITKQISASQKFFAVGDSDLLYRAFYNIMGNALQAMETTGTLSIRVQSTEINKTHHSVITFTDSGMGFPKEHLQQLLDPFFTTKHDGTGLGLAIVNNIIISHKGTLTLSNAKGGGAQVQITLPLITNS